MGRKKGAKFRRSLLLHLGGAASELATAIETSAPGCTLYLAAVITCWPGDKPSSTTERPSIEFVT